MSLTKQRAEQATTLLRDAGFSDEEILQFRDSKPKQTRVNRSNFPTEILDLLKTLGTITREQVQRLPSCPSAGANQRKTIGRAMTKVGEELIKSGHDGLEQPTKNTWRIGGWQAKDYELGAKAERILQEKGRVDILVSPFSSNDYDKTSKYLLTKGYEEGTYGKFTRNDI
jgi:hypothetical protein